MARVDAAPGVVNDRRRPNEDPGSVMDQMGHTDAGFTMRVYRHGMRRDKVSRRAWEELVGRSDRTALDAAHFGAIGGESGQPMGSQSDLEGFEAAFASRPGRQEAPR